jgi:hypothetical protein
MAKLPTRSKTSLGFPKARTPIDPFDPSSVNPNNINLEVNEGEQQTNEKTIDRTEIVKQKHENKYKRENKQ